MQSYISALGQPAMSDKMTTTTSEKKKKKRTEKQKGKICPEGGARGISKVFYPQISVSVQ